MTDELVKFETAILAKEKGFDEKCFSYYAKQFNDSFKNENGQIFNCVVKDDDGDVIGFSNRRNAKGQPHIVIAPTQSLLQRWLREKHNIDIRIDPPISTDSTYTAQLFQKRYSATKSIEVVGKTVFFRYYYR